MHEQNSTLDREQLAAMVAPGESEHLELKKSTAAVKAAVCTLCAMLKGGGGRVILGVTDNGRMLGQHTSSGTYESLAAELRRIEPPVVPEIHSVALDQGREVIVLTVGPGPDAPYTVDGRPYERRGPTTIVMPHAA
jgi:predicted HTH transcriptional regulator